MASPSDVVVSIPGLTKDIFDKNYRDVRASYAVIQELYPFQADQPLGGLYKQPVVNGYQGGVSLYPSGGTPVSPTVQSFTMQYASVNGFNMSLPVQFPFETLAKAKNGQLAAYANEAGLIMLSVKRGIDREVELSMLLGEFGLATAAAGGSAVTTTATMIVDPLYWAEGIFFGTIGFEFDLLDTVGGTARLNANGPLVLQSFNPATRTLVFSENTSDAAAVNTALSTGGTRYILVRRNAYTTAGAFSAANWRECLGLLGALSASSGTVFGLNVGLAGGWLASQPAVSGPLTWGRVLSGIAPAISRGFASGANLLLPPRSWADLLKDAIIYRRLDSSYSSKVLRNGASMIEFVGGHGVIRAVECIYMPDGFAALTPAAPDDGKTESAKLPQTTVRRVGAMEASMDIAGRELVVMDSANDQLVMKMYTNQSLFINALTQCVLFSAITPTS